MRNANLKRETIVALAQFFGVKEFKTLDTLKKAYEAAPRDYLKLKLDGLFQVLTKEPSSRSGSVLYAHDRSLYLSLQTLSIQLHQRQKEYVDNGSRVPKYLDGFLKILDRLLETPNVSSKSVFSARPLDV